MKNVFRLEFVNEAARNAGDITSQMTTMIATGNLSSKTGLGLMQVGSSRLTF